MDGTSTWSIFKEKRNLAHAPELPFLLFICCISMFHVPSLCCCVYLTPPKKLADDQSLDSTSGELPSPVGGKKRSIYLKIQNILAAWRQETFIISWPCIQTFYWPFIHFVCLFVFLHPNGEKIKSTAFYRSCREISHKGRLCTPTEMKWQAHIFTCSIGPPKQVRRQTSTNSSFIFKFNNRHCKKKKAAITYMWRCLK